MLCRRTSNSSIVEEFILQNIRMDKEKESLKRTQTIKDVPNDHIVIFEHDGKQHLAKVIEIKESQMVVVAQCYEPVLSLSTYNRCFNKIGNQVTISLKNIIASIPHQPVFNRRDQLVLPKEQFIDIQKFFS